MPEAAQLWADRLTAAARRSNDEFNRMLGRMESEDYVRAHHFLMVLAEQLQGEENSFASVQHWIEERLKQPLTEVVRAEHAREAAESVATAQAFGSLRLLAQFDFTAIFDAVSLVEAELRLDPAGIYTHSDFATRDRCRRIGNRLLGPAQRKRSRSRPSPSTLLTPRKTRLIGTSRHWLLAEGISQLEHAAGANRACEPVFTARFAGMLPGYTWAASLR